ncbi:MAG: hypothetical protein Q4G68_13990 [Planctomycetia bacterium]|nr:hypothetical protein [Planctomycetia bacterium]
MPFTSLSAESASKAPVNVYLCGNLKRSDFKSVVSCLKSEQASLQYNLRLGPRLDDFLAVPEKERASADMIFLLQETLDEYEIGTLVTIRREFPLAVIVVIMGALCEGASRTRPIVTGCIRFYWHEWASFGQSQFEAFIGRKNGTFLVPITGTVGDQLREAGKRRSGSLLSRIFSGKSPIHSKKQGTEVLIISTGDSTVAQMVFDFANAACSRARRVSFEEVLNEKNAPARVIIDSDNLGDPDFFANVEQIARNFPLVPIDILAFSPRPHEVRRYILLNNCMVFPKPFL